MNILLSTALYIVECFSKSASADLMDIHHAGSAVATAYSLPMFSAWLARETGDPAQILSAVRQARTAPEFVEARERLREIRRLFDESGIAHANVAALKLLREINQVSDSLRTKYGIKTRQGIPATKLVQLYNSVAALKGLPEIPDLGLKVPVPEFLSNLRQPRGFSAVYRNLTNDLSTVWSLGEARDILGGRVIKGKDAMAYSPKQEKPRYRNEHSQFKSPM